MNNEKKDNREHVNYSGLEMPGRSKIGQPAAGGYEILVKDHLETYWFEWFEGWSIVNVENGEVLLKSDNVDQSKLHGALNKIRDLNLMLLSVTRIPSDHTAEAQK